jgi:hypothetical protein
MLRHTLRRFHGEQAGRGTLILRTFPQQNREKHDWEELPVQGAQGLPARAQACLGNLMVVHLKAELDRIPGKYLVPRDVAHVLVQYLPPVERYAPAAAL